MVTTYQSSSTQPCPQQQSSAEPKLVKTGGYHADWAMACSPAPSCAICPCRSNKEPGPITFLRLAAWDTQEWAEGSTG